MIAVVLNVATDGESLELMETCGLRLIPRVDAKDGEGTDEAEEGAKEGEEEQEQETEGNDSSKPEGASEGGDAAAATATSAATRDLPPILSMSLDARLIDRHEVLLALFHRDRADSDLWHVVGVGEQVKGEWRDKEESQNFLNALPLSQRYLELLDICKVDHAEKKVMHPFKMVPGDILEVPALAVETPVVIGMGWDVDPDVAMDLDCGLAVYSEGQVRSVDG